MLRETSCHHSSVGSLMVNLRSCGRSACVIILLHRWEEHPLAPQMPSWHDGCSWGCSAWCPFHPALSPDMSNPVILAFLPFISLLFPIISSFSPFLSFSFSPSPFQRPLRLSKSQPVPKRIAKRNGCLLRAEASSVSANIEAAQL